MQATSSRLPLHRECVPAPAVCQPWQRERVLPGGRVGAPEGEEPCAPPTLRGRDAHSGDSGWDVGAGGWIRNPSRRGGGLCRSNFQKAFVLFHTETIKALKQGFGAELNRVPSQARRLLPFYWSACSLRFLPLPPGPGSAALARVNYAHLLGPRIFRTRLFLLSSVSAAPCGCRVQGASPCPAARLLRGAGLRVGAPRRCHR